MQPPRRRTFPAWFRAQTRFSKIGLGCGVLIVSGLICFVSLVAYGSTLPKPPQQAQAPTATPLPPNTPTQAVVATATTAIASTQPTNMPTPTDTPVPTATPTTMPTPKPTPSPAPTRIPPTATPCPGLNCNPWGYNFSPGTLIYTPPTGFCSYFNCIASFYSSDDPGDGYINECADGTYSQSGGERGDCSSHGGELRPLYAH